ncbi:MAG TPA: hypothetical protein PKV33_05510 [Methanothrix sp.]|nr:hypothetical protein [Methanothrix sp.]
MSAAKDDKKWSPLALRIVEITLGMMLSASSVYIFILNFYYGWHDAYSVLSLIITPIELTLFAIPAFIGFSTISAGAFGKDPAIIVRKNLNILLFFVVVMTLIVPIGFSIKEIAPCELKIDQAISFGDLFTPITIIISLATISYGWFRDQQQRKKEYADRIRSAAGTILAIIARRNSLNERFFENIQPIILDSISLIIKNGDNEQSREYIWKEIVKEGMNTTQRRLEEPLEEAFKDLYGYDSQLQKAFADSIHEMTRIEGYIYMVTLRLFQIQVNSLFMRQVPCEKRLERAHLAKMLDWNRIPGEDTEKLIEFLRNRLGIERIERQSIKKTEDEMTINASGDNKIISLEINERKTEVILKINGEKHIVLLAKIAGKELNLYGIKSEYAPTSKEMLVSDLKKAASMLSYEQDYLINSIISSFGKPLMNLIISEDDDISKMRIDLSVQPLSKSWYISLDGLKLCTQGRFIEAIKFYDQALDTDSSIAGLWAGKSLAHLGCLDLEGWNEANLNAIKIIYND